MRYLPAYLFMAAGLGLLAVNTGNNLAEINRTGFGLDTSAVIVGLAVMSALLSLFVVPVWRLSRPTALLAGVIVLGCTITSVRLTTDRIGGVDDSGRQLSRNTNGRIARADQVIAALSKKVEAERPIAGLECRGYVEGRSSPKLWPKCLTARSLISDYETKLEAAQAERGTLGEKVTEARHSERFLAWIAPWSDKIAHARSHARVSVWCRNKGRWVYDTTLAVRSALPPIADQRCQELSGPLWANTGLGVLPRARIDKLADSHYAARQSWFA